MVEIIKIERSDFQKALLRAEDTVLKDGIIIYPTDTLYGIGGNAFSKKVVDRIRAIKGTPEGKPYSVVMSNIGMIERYCEVDDWQRQVLKKHLPGPFTFLLKQKRSFPVTHTDKLGVRVPDSPFAHQLAELADIPIITTSANPTGQKPPRRLEEIKGRIISAADLAIDGGVTKYSEASAVVDLIEKKVVRRGVWEIELFGY